MTAILDLLILAVALVPLGSVVLRMLERLLRLRFSLSTVERGLLALYLAGTVFLLLASIPVPIFGFPLVIGLLLGGVAGLVVLWIRERFVGLRALVSWIHTWPAVTLLLGTLGLLVLEVASAGTNPFPNSFDGSVQTTFLQVLLRNHSLGWTLQPYSGGGIMYPQGATVWFSLPVLLFGWPVYQSPVTLSALFLSLGVVGAYCWGERLAGGKQVASHRMGLLFAAFFGLVASWPRLFIGGSYDFAFSLPLFLATLGWLGPYVRGFPRPWIEAVAFGGLLGVEAALSPTAGQAVFVLLLGFLLIFHNRSTVKIGRSLARVGVILGVGLLFVLRSIVGFVVWYGYPAHTLVAAGNPPYAPPMFQGSVLGWDAINADLNPFVPWKGKLSPIPALSLEVAILLAAGLSIAVLWWLIPSHRLRRLLPGSMLLPILAATGILLVSTGFLVVAVVASPQFSLISTVTQPDEFSYLLFIAYSSVGLVPLIVALNYLELETATPTTTTGVRISSEHVHLSGFGRNGSALSRRRVAEVVSLVLVVSLTIGAVETVQSVPPYLSSHLQEFSNVTANDVSALHWAGTHLPTCSRVLVAPGSAAEFLPVFGVQQIVYPMEPGPVNLSYYIAVNDLQADIYNGTTREALLLLDVTEVFVTGRTSVEFLPFEITPLESSTDFSNVFHSGDASIFVFLPDTAGQCSWVSPG